MDVERHLLALRHEGAALSAAARDGDLGNAVPSCPEWDVAALLAHTAHGYRWVTKIVRTHADAEVEPQDVPPATTDDAVAAFDEALAELVETLVTEAPDAPAWNWSGHDLTVAFWARRMAHETAVHRWDAQLAHGGPQPIEPDLAADGVDEMLTVFLGDYLAGHPQDGLGGTFRAEATDTGDVWAGTLRPDHAEVSGGDAGPADATVRGTASDLVLAFWGRGTPIETTGDPRITGLLTQ